MSWTHGARHRRRRVVRAVAVLALVLGAAGIIAVSVSDQLRYSVWLRVPGAQAVLDDPQASTLPQVAVPASPDALRGRDDVRFGIATSLRGYGPDLEARGRRIRATGARWIRLEAHWRTIERRPGDYAWGRLDTEVRAATRVGLRVLLMPEDPPAWAEPVQRRYAKDPRTFAAFVAQVGMRYGPEGAFWRTNPDLDGAMAVPELEILNEPWVRVFGDGTDARPRTYARTVEAVGRAVRRQAPRSRLLVAMESSWLEADGYQRPWIEPMFDEVPGLGRWIDGIAVHPYSSRSPLHETPGVARADFRRIGDVLGLLRSEGVRDKDVWITELGYASCRPGTRNECMTDAGQAAAVRDLFTAIHRRPAWRVRMALLYTLDDGTGDPLDPEQRFGLIRPDGSRKPAYERWRRGVAGWPALQARAGG